MKWTRAYWSFAASITVAHLIGFFVDSETMGAMKNPNAFFVLAGIFALVFWARLKVYDQNASFFDVDRKAADGPAPQLVFFGNVVEDVAPKRDERSMLATHTVSSSRRGLLIAATLGGIILIGFVWQKMRLEFGIPFSSVVSIIVIATMIAWSIFVSQLLLVIAAVIVSGLLVFFSSPPPDVVPRTEFFPFLAFAFITAIFFAIHYYRQMISFRLNDKLRVDELRTVRGSITACVLFSVLYIGWDRVLPKENPFKLKSNGGTQAQSKPGGGGPGGASAPGNSSGRGGGDQFKPGSFSREVAEKLVEKFPGLADHKNLPGGSAPGGFDGKLSGGGNGQLSGRGGGGGGKGDLSQGSRELPDGRDRASTEGAPAYDGKLPTEQDVARAKDLAKNSDAGQAGGGIDAGGGDAPAGAAPGGAPGESTGADGGAKNAWNDLDSLKGLAKGDDAGRLSESSPGGDRGGGDNPPNRGESARRGGDTAQADRNRTGGDNGMGKGNSPEAGGDSMGNESMGKESTAASAVKDASNSNSTKAQSSPSSVPKPNIEPLVAKIEVVTAILKAVGFLILMGAVIYYLSKILSSAKKNEKKPLKTYSLSSEQLLKFKTIFDQIRRKGLRAEQEVIETYNAVLMLFENTHFPRAEWLPTQEYSNQVAAELPKLGRQFESATVIFGRTLYGEKAVDTVTLEQFRSDVGQVLKFFGLR